MSHHGHRQTEFERVVPAKSPFGKPVRRIHPLTLEQERDWDIAVATGHWPAVRKQAPLTDREAARLAREEMEVEFGPETPQGDRFGEITNAPGAVISVRDYNNQPAFIAQQLIIDRDTGLQELELAFHPRAESFFRDPVALVGLAFILVCLAALVL